MVWAKIADLINVLTVILWTHFSLDNPSRIIHWNESSNSYTEAMNHKSNKSGVNGLVYSKFHWVCDSSCDWWNAVRGRSLRRNTCLPALGECESWTSKENPWQHSCVRWITLNLVVPLRGNLHFFAEIPFLSLSKLYVNKRTWACCDKKDFSLDFALYKR